jgi:hypothetical protein
LNTLSQPATVLPECIRALVWQVGGRGEPEYKSCSPTYSAKFLKS